MKYYLEAIIAATNLFTIPGIVPDIDDLVYRRMIKCCAHLQCNTQAVVLCQFLNEVDYALAFKMAGTEQKNAVPNDAMDAYYHCIWDTTILEYLINLHTKRGEHHRKQLAVTCAFYKKKSNLTLKMLIKFEIIADQSYWSSGIEFKQ